MIKHFMLLLQAAAPGSRTCPSCRRALGRSQDELPAPLALHPEQRVQYGRSRMRLLAASGAALAGCGAGSAAVTPPTTGAVDANATVEYVVDGDTIDVLVDGAEERVRLIGIDTPEMNA